MQRQTFRTGAWRLAVAAVVCLLFGLTTPALALAGQRPLGLVATVLVPVVMLPLAFLCVYYGLIRRLRIDIDPSGVTVSRGPRQFSLPWSGVRSIGVLPANTRGQPVAVLVVWPTAQPAPGRSPAPAAFDADLRAYVVVQVAHLAAGPEDLAAAVERVARGKWGVPAA